MKYISALLFLAFFTIQGLNAQLSGSLSISNDSEKINDGRAEVTVENGQPPYTYKWTNQKTPLTSSMSSGLVEGVEFSVIVTDANGESVELKGEVQPESSEEVINSLFLPAVNALSSVLFWAPLESFGITDPTVYYDHEKIYAKGYKDESVKAIFLLEWYAEDGEHVEPGDKVALIRRNSADTITLFAHSSGVIEHLFQEGERVFDKEDRRSAYDLTNGLIANVNFGESRPLLHPNGDKQKKPIPFIVMWLVAGALFFTIRMGFINFRGVKHALGLVAGKYEDPNDKGEVSHFQALTTALSATVGLGNIAGVSIAIVIGGPGATFWMIIAGLLGMASKFTECTLGVKYRKINEKGEVSGGPMYYLSEGLKRRNLGNLGKVLAAVFAILCVGGSLGGGNMFQSNQAFVQVSNKIALFEGNGTIFGVILAILVGLVILGGIKSIARVTDKIVPVMVGIYVGFAIIIILIHLGNIGDAFEAIFDGAFSAPAMKGGIIGVLVVGFQRAAFSNEAGVGSASIAHSASKTKYPISEGIVALLEPFVDTVVVCTMTALVLIFTGFAADPESMTASELTTAAFSSVFSWFDWVLLIAIVLFAFSTMISWSYYGLKSWTYLFGKSKRSQYAYKSIFLVFIVIGSSVGLGSVLDFSDLMILGMAFPNIFGLVLLSGEVRNDMKQYFSDLKTGVIKRFK
jgi:AGCS family alanine or glycine:cation symporter